MAKSGRRLNFAIDRWWLPASPRPRHVAYVSLLRDSQTLGRVEGHRDFDRRRVE